MNPDQRILNNNINIYIYFYNNTIIYFIFISLNGRKNLKKNPGKRKLTIIVVIITIDK